MIASRHKTCIIELKLSRPRGSDGRFNSTFISSWETQIQQEQSASLVVVAQTQPSSQGHSPKREPFAPERPTKPRKLLGQSSALHGKPPSRNAPPKKHAQLLADKTQQQRSAGLLPLAPLLVTQRVRRLTVALVPETNLLHFPGISPTSRLTAGVGFFVPCTPCAN